ncbi:MAG: DUF5615 family PIN-like protein [Chloroflexota bacterium]
MLSLILDENISPVIAEQVSLRRPDIPIQSIFHWRGGALVMQRDHLILQAAAEDGLTLVTYDVSTIRPLVAEWGIVGTTHAGVIFIDERTIRSNDFGGLVTAIERLWSRQHHQDWTNYTQFLDRP